MVFDPTILTDLASITTQLNDRTVEASTMKVEVNLDYSTEGLRAFAEALSKARSSSDRIAHILAGAKRALGHARVLQNNAKAQYQDIWDDAVIHNASRYAGQNLSWSERDSFYRTSTIDGLIFLRKVENQIAEIEAQVEYIEAISRSIFRARGDLSSITDVMRVGSLIGDV